MHGRRGWRHRRASGRWLPSTSLERRRWLLNGHEPTRREHADVPFVLLAPWPNARTHRASQAGAASKRTVSRT